MANLFDKIKAFLKGGRTSFTAFEMAILNEVMKELDSPRAERLRKRIRSINFISVLDGGREVNCYTLVHGRPTIDNTTRVSDGTGEEKLATFVVDGETTTKNTGTIWLVDGRFFSINFSEPTEHASPAEITRIEIAIQ
jgi:hypothetical protein